jgi:hypothetical protein
MFEALTKSQTIKTFCPDTFVGLKRECVRVKEDVWSPHYNFEESAKI